MQKTLLNLLFIMGFIFLAQRCGRNSSDDDDSGGSDARVPAGWDGASDYSDSALKFTQE